MILYVSYFFLLSMFFLNTSPYFTFAFDAVGVPAGGRSVVIQLVSILVSIAILATHRKHKMLFKELQNASIVWLPWLVYIAMRTDFGDAYSELKFAKMVIVQFVLVLTITTVYLSNMKKFDKYFFPAIIALGSLLIIEAILNPKVFLYASEFERMEIEGVNPILLARSFAIAAMCILLMPIKQKYMKYGVMCIFVLGILPTNSRGPLLSLIIVLMIYWVVQNKKTKNIGLKVSAMGFVVFFSLLVIGPIVQNTIGNYLARGSEKGMFEESGRSMLFKKAITEFAASPVLGSGLGKFGRTETESNGIQGLSQLKGFYPHNILLEVLTELGIVGFVLFIIIFRPGKWMRAFNNRYLYLFIMYLLFAMTSGNTNTNTGLIIFAILARLAYRYPPSGDNNETGSGEVVHPVRVPDKNNMRVWLKK